jgi:threonyl-tRNA synthetase
MSEFGLLHRNEGAGAHSGLTRRRQFVTDDVRTFCRSDQISREISGALDFVRHVYLMFRLTLEILLSTTHLSQ